MKICCKCKSAKELSDFQNEKRRLDGVSSRCKLCLNEDKKSYLDGKRNKIREYNRRKYYENHETQKVLRTQRSKKLREENSECIREYKKKWWNKHAPRLRKKQNELRKLPEKKKKRNQYIKENTSLIELAKMQARKIFRTAVSSGYLTRPEQCEKCNKQCKPEGHHEDYSKPLEIRWLCRVCHNHEHGKLLDLTP
jgi:hypothetical protein